jgi:hypothetical protein
MEHAFSYFMTSIQYPKLVIKEKKKKVYLVAGCNWVKFDKSTYWPKIIKKKLKIHQVLEEKKEKKRRSIWFQNISKTI